MKNAEILLEGVGDTSYDSSSSNLLSPNFKGSFNEILETKFGDKYTATNTIHYPWVGSDYKKQSTKILVILESSYLIRNETDCSIAESVDSLCDMNYSRRVLEQAAILGRDGGYYSPTYVNLNKLLTGDKDTLGAARRDLWRTLALYNFVTCPVDWSRKIKNAKKLSEIELRKKKELIDRKITKGSRVSYNKLKDYFPDFIEGKDCISKGTLVKSKDLEVFKKVVGVLQPNACIIASARIWGFVGRRLMDICKQNNIKIVFTLHPGCPGFSSDKERSKLPEEIKKVLAKIAK